jgi:signal transduction histidine kinase
MALTPLRLRQYLEGHSFDVLLPAAAALARQRSARIALLARADVPAGTSGGPPALLARAALVAAAGAVSSFSPRAGEGAEEGGARLHGLTGALSLAALAFVEASRGVVTALRAERAAEYAYEHRLDTLLWLAASADTLGRHVAASAPRALLRPPVRLLDVTSMLQLDVPDVAAFCREKNGAAPPVMLERVQADGHSVPLRDGAPVALTAAVPEQLSFAFREVLKNSMAAHIERYGAAGVEDAPPIVVSLSMSERHVCLCVEDRGGGLSLLRRPVFGPATRFPYFATTAAPRQPNYTYSRQFGEPFSGHGTGLPRARLYALAHGGGLALTGGPGRGTSALLWAEATGDASDDPRSLNTMTGMAPAH